MMKNILILIGLLISSMAIAAGRGDDPLLAKVMIDQFELRNTAGPDPIVLQGQAWIGKDMDKLWMKADSERVSGKTEELELQFLYSTAIAPYWDAQIGWRHDKLSGPKRDWLAFGFQGLAPYFFEIDTAVFIGEGGQTAIRFEAEYEILLTQKLILSELGLRLRYEITREFAPYIGINWTSMYGKTADIAKLAGEDKTDTQFVVGVRAWF
jgi:copper resistance protein B